MNVAVAIPCYRQERWLHRTVTAVEQALAGRTWEGVIVRAAPGREPLPALGPAWRVSDPPVARALTPGAARMLGLSATQAPWVLFCDADVQVDPAWMAAALGRAGAIERAAALGPAAAPGAAAGFGGRLEEWFEDRGAERMGSRDMYRVGDAEAEVRYLATPALYRRDALLQAGGYEARLTSEEDFELGMRLRRTGARMISLGFPAGRHWSAPRPTLAELGRRWRTGLCFGQGQVLRLYLGRPGLGELLARQRLYLATLAGWLLGLAALGALPRSPRPLAAWIAAAALGLVAMAVRKRSLRLAAFSLLTWSVNAAGLVRGFVAGPLREAMPATPGARP